MNKSRMDVLFHRDILSPPDVCPHGRFFFGHFVSQTFVPPSIYPSGHFVPPDVLYPDVSSLVVIVPDHDGGWPKEINAWFLYTDMVYL